MLGISKSQYLPLWRERISRIWNACLNISDVPHDNSENYETSEGSVLQKLSISCWTFSMCTSPWSSFHSETTEHDLWFLCAGHILEYKKEREIMLLLTFPTLHLAETLYFSHSELSSSTTSQPFLLLKLHMCCSLPGKVLLISYVSHWHHLLQEVPWLFQTWARWLSRVPPEPPTFPSPVFIMLHCNCLQTD